MAALLVIDMQVGCFRTPTERHDTDGVVDRINALAEALRNAGGHVVFVQHDGPAGEQFEPGSPDWEFLPELQRSAADKVVRKRACDSFYETGLQNILQQHGSRRLIVTGCATDFCVDTTIRAALSLDFEVVVARDGHTTTNRPHLDAVSIIEHHNSVWEELIHPRIQVQVLPTAEIIRGLDARAAVV